MRAIHLRMSRLTADWAADAAKWTIRKVGGVTDVAVLASLGIVSVLFDERIATTEQILAVLRAAGFDARPI